MPFTDETYNQQYTRHVEGQLGLDDKLMNQYSGKIKLDYDIAGGDAIAFFKLSEAKPLVFEATTHLSYDSSLGGKILLETESALAEVRTHIPDNIPVNELEGYALIQAVHDYYVSELETAAKDYVSTIGPELSFVSKELGSVGGLSKTFELVNSLIPLAYSNLDMSVRLDTVQYLGEALENLRNFFETSTNLESGVEFPNVYSKLKQDISDAIEVVRPEVRDHLNSIPSEDQILVQNMKWHKR